MIQRKYPFHFFLPLAIAMAIATWRALPAPAAEAGSTASLAVTGSHNTTVMPTTAEIVVTTSSTAELTGDVVTKFRAAAKQVIDACQALGIKGLKIEPEGFRLGTETPGGNAFQVANQQANAKSQMWLGCKVKLILTGIQDTPQDQLMDTISKILDTAKDAGATLTASSGGNNAMVAMLNGGGVTPAVTFVVEDAQQALKDSRQKAFEKAKSNAENLASLAGKQLGSVVTLSESSGAVKTASAADAQVQLLSAIYGAGGGDKSAAQPARITSDHYGPIPVETHLAVTFVLLP